MGHVVEVAPVLPGTLAGRLVLALALADPVLFSAAKRLLAASGWRDASRVVVAVVYEVVCLRWPADHDPDEVHDVVQRAVAMLPRSELADATAIEWIVRNTLGEEMEAALDERERTRHRLAAIMAFVKLLDLAPLAIVDLIVRAERYVVGRGYAPTPAPP